MMPKDGFSKFIWPGNQENQETRVFFVEKKLFLFVGTENQTENAFLLAGRATI